jgi:hypothetical protein
MHNFSLDYPWVMTPLSNTKGNFSVYVLTVVRWRGYVVWYAIYSLSKRCPRSSMSWSDTHTVVVSTTWRPFPHSDDSVINSHFKCVCTVSSYYCALLSCFVSPSVKFHVNWRNWRNCGIHNSLDIGLIHFKFCTPSFFPQVVQVVHVCRVSEWLEFFASKFSICQELTKSPL